MAANTTLYLTYFSGLIIFAESSPLRPTGSVILSVIKLITLRTPHLLMFSFTYALFVHSILISTVNGGHNGATYMTVTN